MKRIAILQSNYVPWKGYFDLINAVDEFIFYDDVQYTHHDWRNRNQVKTPKGRDWISIPISTSGKFGQKICDTEVTNPDWARKHWDRLRQLYGKAPHFRAYGPRFEELYLGCRETRLSLINYRFIAGINAMLGIGTPLRWSMDYELGEGKTERLVSLCEQVGADAYLSGPSGGDYLDVALLERAGIRLEWADYTGYPEYPQLYPPFEHGVSIVDLIFSTGPGAREYMKSFSGRFIRAHRA